MLYCLRACVDHGMVTVVEESMMSMAQEQVQEESSTSAHTYKQTDQLAQLQDLGEIDDILIDELNKEIKDTEQDLVAVADMMRDIGVMVQDQGEHLEFAEDYLEGSVGIRV
jgi:hypothetical protein